MLQCFSFWCTQTQDQLTWKKNGIEFLTIYSIVSISNDNANNNKNVCTFFEYNKIMNKKRQFVYFKQKLKHFEFFFQQIFLKFFIFRLSDNYQWHPKVCMFQWEKSLCRIDSEFKWILHLSWNLTFCSIGRIYWIN